LILVSPWKIADKGNLIKENFYNFTIDPKLKERVNQIIYFTSNNEDPNGLESLEIFYKILDGKIIKLKNRGHYCFEDMGTVEFPELLEEIL
jgi:predicted alpha/beta hydrolase family esterase